MPLTPEAKKEIVSILQTAMKRCSPPMVISKQSTEGMELIGNKEVPYGSKKVLVPGMYFCSYVVRKDMVSFYFFPMYMAMPHFEALMPTLKKCIKGKSCFNFKKADQVDKKELEALLKKGLEVWKKLEYLK
jgi:ABC-type dipeptide/oligopeptide/nickel transport system ATPase component